MPAPTATPFEVICEIEPATTPDLKRVRHQIGALSQIATSFLIPDNHIGRATVSSVAVAHEVEAMGGRSIACLNARDRNLLGFRRDLLTAAAYGVDQFLFVYGDEPAAGARTSELTVRTMIEEGRAYADTLAPGAAVGTVGGRGGGVAMRFGAATGLRPLPAWKRAADFLFVQIGFSLEEFLAWRARVDVSVPVYAGVIVIASPKMAKSLEIPGLTVPEDLVERLERDRNAGVDVACDLVTAIRDSGAFDGVHLIPVARYREVAARLRPGAPEWTSLSPSTPASSSSPAPRWPEPRDPGAHRPRGPRRAPGADRKAGVDVACDMVTGEPRLGSFDGVTGSPWRATARIVARLERLL